MWNKTREILALTSVVTVLVGLPIMIYGYHQNFLVARYGEDTQIIDLYATADGGKWVTQPVNGMNYWWQDFKNGDTLNVEVEKPVVLRLTSTDVLHSFAIPGIRELRRPIDIEAGKWKTVSFTAEEEDELTYLCWQYCSDQHETMYGEIVAVQASEPELLAAKLLPGQTP